MLPKNDRISGTYADRIFEMSSKLIVVRDDHHHGEMANDVPFIRGMLIEGGHETKCMEEPKEGLRPRDIEAYDVVWFSNPG